MIAGVPPWAADPVSPDVVTPLLQYGLPGLVVVLFLLGWLIPKGVYESVREERDKWRQAWETEQAAHQLTRATLAEANARADAAVEAARTAASTLRALGHMTAPSGDR